MKLGLLQCDHVVTELQSAHGDYPEQFKAVFERAGVSVDWQCFDATQKILPDDIDCCDAYITTGSRFGAYESLPWLTALQGFLRQLYQVDKPFVGICFGHQLMAQVLGGKVEKSAKGWGIGVSFNQVKQPKSWMRPFKPEVDLWVSHQDQVVELPAEIEVLGGSQFCPNYIIQRGKWLGIQGHPEFTKAYSRDLIKLRSEKYSPERVREAEYSMAASVDSERIIQWIAAFIQESLQNP
ncbi:GMP synthase [Endozoicomonas sp. SM1973]|uniref:GMP synthase n=1 Tax=Spartinivicinus marinus TaxID=2994442 RepID=A0A853IED8_9GAMM|nr:GMP synthase [Spartinivicinus marinus]NYZ67545.1 GMP synthase [Spartinivicinus marinus]